MPTVLLSAQIEMKECRQTVAFLIKIRLRRVQTTGHHRQDDSDHYLFHALHRGNLESC